MIHPLDVVVQQELPTVLVPRFGEFVALAQQGQRLLLASDGIWLEVNTGWLYARVPYQLLSPQLPVLPYGHIEQMLLFKAGPVPVGFLKRFVATAKGNSQVEQAALILLDLESGVWRYVEPGVIENNGAKVSYHYPEMGEQETLVADLHSHAGYSAGFSRIDDADDRAAFKLAVVIGDCHREQVSVAARLCLRGVFLDMSESVEGSLWEVEHV